MAQAKKKKKEKKNMSKKKSISRLHSTTPL
jgi:hypothetical protein